MVDEEMLDKIAEQDQKIQLLIDELGKQSKEIEALKLKVRLYELLLYGTTVKDWSTL